MRTPTASSRTHAFTLVEVMMAATILVVGFMGMIQLLTVCNEMQMTARRQTLASQIMEHEFERLRLLPWDVTAASPNELAVYDLPSGSTSITIDSQFDDAIRSVGLVKGSSLTLSRTATTVTSADTTREITLTITWTKGGTTAATSAAHSQSISTLDQLAFSRASTVSRTYTRTRTAVFGKYGISTSIRRS